MPFSNQDSKIDARYVAGGFNWDASKSQVERTERSDPGN
jgi:hypothetical protein